MSVGVWLSAHENILPSFIRDCIMRCYIDKVEKERRFKISLLLQLGKYRDLLTSLYVTATIFFLLLLLSALPGRALVLLSKAYKHFSSFL